MACSKSELKDSYLTELQSIKTTIHNKFESLHISLDERESDLLFELEGIRGTIESALKQWDKKVQDVKHTQTHANTEIQDNKWSYKLLGEANEELSFLERSKPCFDVEFKLNGAIKDVFSSLGEISMERTNRRRTRVFLRSDQTAVTAPDDKFDQPTALENFTQGNLCQIFPVEECRAKNEFEFERKEKFVRNLPKLKKCVSCLEMSTIHVLTPEIQSKHVLRAFDDSCIVKESIIQQPYMIAKQQQQQQQQQQHQQHQQQQQQQQQDWKYLTVNYREKKSKDSNAINTRKGSGIKKLFMKSFKKGRSSTIQGASYNLSEMKIHKCLAKQVSLYSRWDRTKEVTGTLRCVVTGDEKVPIVGIELGTADGTSNGYYKGIQYFKTDRFKAYFLPADQVNIVM